MHCGYCLDLQSSHGRLDGPSTQRDLSSYSLFPHQNSVLFLAKRISSALRASIYTLVPVNLEGSRRNGTTMSTKGFSVGPVHYPSAPGFPLPQSPSSSFRSNRIPSYSIPPPPVPDFSRQVSNKILYTPSIAPSVTGTSTGTALGSASESRRKRREKEANGRSTINKEDWAEIEPDEVFRRLQVREVKRVETKMRSEALNKQSELRAMVG